MISRRAFLLGLAAGGLGGITIGKIVFEPHLECEGISDALLAEAASIFSERKAALRIGERYLDEHPEFDREQLTTSLFGPLRITSLGTSSEDFHARLRIMRYHDFLEGRVVELEGWLLSLTEVRLAALLFLRLHEQT